MLGYFRYQAIKHILSDFLWQSKHWNLDFADFSSLFPTPSIDQI